MSTLADWIAQDAAPFSLDSPATLDGAVDRLMAALDPGVELLGMGEALHGGEELLTLRNRLFQRLVTAHGFSAIALESGITRGKLVNDFVTGQGGGSYDDVRDAGFDNLFGRVEANRELVEWIRDYNARRDRRVTLRFYGFDLPVGTTRGASPRQTLGYVLDYLESHGDGPQRRQRIDELIGEDARWEDPAAHMDPARSIGATPDAAALRLEIEDLVTELRVRRPELAAGDASAFRAALQFAQVARAVLAFHAASARGRGASHVLAIRDALMADNLEYIVDAERGRGRVLAFAHNAHLQRSKAVWPWYEFWPAGSHVSAALGPRYAVVGTALGASVPNGIASAEPGSLEHRLLAAAPTGLLIPTQRGASLPTADLAALPVRTGSARNLSYGPLTTQSLSDFDALAIVPAATFTRGAPPLPPQPS